MDNGDEGLQQTNSESRLESIVVFAGVVSLILVLRLKNED